MRFALRSRLHRRRPGPFALDPAQLAACKRAIEPAGGDVISH